MIMFPQTLLNFFHQFRAVKTNFKDRNEAQKGKLHKSNEKGMLLEFLQRMKVRLVTLFYPFDSSLVYWESKVGSAPPKTMTASRRVLRFHVPEIMDLNECKIYFLQF